MVCPECGRDTEACDVVDRATEEPCGKPGKYVYAHEIYVCDRHGADIRQTGSGRFLQLIHPIAVLTRHQTL